MFLLILSIFEKIFRKSAQFFFLASLGTFTFFLTQILHFVTSLTFFDVFLRFPLAEPNSEPKI